MKKGKIALLGIISVLLLFVVFLPVKAEAAAIIKSGKTIALKDYASAPKYKMTLEEDSVVTVSWSNNVKDKASIFFFYDSRCADQITCSFMDSGVSGKEIYAFKKGVYYIEMKDQAEGGPTTKVTISWGPASAYDQGNYCVDKAISLGANKTTKIVQTYGCNYDHYYKIKITKAPKKVSIIIPYEEGQTATFRTKLKFHIYSEDLKKEYDLNNLTTEEKLPVGTYYIVADALYRGNIFGSYTMFKWK